MTKADNRSTIIYSYPTYSSFVKKDEKLLSQKFHIIKIKFLHFKNKLLLPVEWVIQFYHLIINIRKTDAYYCFFSGYHSFLPSLIGNIFSKPVIIIAGGTDCVSFPSIHYGNFNKKILSLFTKWTYQLSTIIVPVHEALIKYKYEYHNEDYPYQGIKYHVPDLRTPIKPIHNGYDYNFWSYSEENRKPNSFLTIGLADNRKSIIKLKGIDLIIEAAQIFPESSFTIVGSKKVPEYMNIPENVNFIPPVSLDQLKKYYSTHEFYFQLSMSEGFPNSLAEAMLCGCIPIGSNVSGIPEIIGDTGFTLQHKSVAELKKLIEKAQKSDKKELSERAREKIRSDYPIERRRMELLELINDNL